MDADNERPCIVCGRPSVVTDVKDDRAAGDYCLEHAPAHLKSFAAAIAGGGLHELAARSERRPPEPNWTLGAMFDGVYQWSVVHNADSVAAAADRLATAIGRPALFDSPKMKYLQALHDAEIAFELHPWIHDIAWHLGDMQGDGTYRHEGIAATLDDAIDQMVECARRAYGLDVRRGGDAGSARP